jgi:hypothetical protein
MNLYYIETNAQYGDVPEYIWANNYTHAEEIIMNNFKCNISKIELITRKRDIYED